MMDVEFHALTISRDGGPTFPRSNSRGRRRWNAAAAAIGIRDTDSVTDFVTGIVLSGNGLLGMWSHIFVHLNYIIIETNDLPFFRITTGERSWSMVSLSQFSGYPNVYC